MKKLIIIVSALALAACGKSGNNDGNQGSDGGNPGKDGGNPGSDSGNPGSDSGNPGSDAGKPLDFVASPTFSPPGGTYTTAQSVTISCSTAGATIYYTTDGSDPTTASTRYAAPISVAQSQTLRTFANAAGRTPSAVASASYIIGGNATYTAGCAAYQAKFLSLFASCYKANPLFVQWVYGESTCAATQKEIDKGRVSYDAAKGAACDAAIPNLTCDYLYGKAALPAECLAMLTGKVAANGTCYSSDECQSGFCSSETVNGTCPGTCKPFVVADGSCADGAWCGAGLECFQDVCKKPSAAGGACPCQAGFWCERVDGSQTGTCKAVLPAGATCDAWSCAPGLICAGEPATCKALAGEGDACTPADGPTECGEGYHCDKTTKKCVSDPTVGRACASDVFCIDAYCDETTTPSAPVCKALIADGGACTGDEQCVSFSCTSGKCDSAGSRSCLAP